MQWQLVVSSMLERDIIGLLLIGAAIASPFEIIMLIRKITYGMYAFCVVHVNCTSSVLS